MKPTIDNKKVQSGTIRYNPVQLGMLILIFFILMLTSLYAACFGQAAICDSVHMVSGNQVDTFSLVGVIRDCPGSKQFVTDVWHSHGVRFHYHIEGRTWMETEPWDGYHEYILLPNKDMIVRSRSRVPGNHKFHSEPVHQLSRLIIYTTDPSPDIITHATESQTVRLSPHCDTIKVITRRDTIPVCYSPAIDQEFVITNNCDTLIRDSIDMRFFPNRPDRDTIITIGSPRTDTIYHAVPNEYGCIPFKKIITYIAQEQAPYIPNVFSPNNDGVNDRFGLDERFDYRMTISNRWGHTVYSGTSSWDGTYNSNPVPSGVYVYVIRVMGNAQFERQIFSGDVTVIR